MPNRYSGKHGLGDMVGFLLMVFSKKFVGDWYLTPRGYQVTLACQFINLMLISSLSGFTYAKNIKNRDFATI